MNKQELVDALVKSEDLGMDLDIPVMEQLIGINKALRVILRCGEGESLLRRAATVMRRADRLAEKYPEFGPI